MNKDIESRFFLFLLSVCPLIDLLNGYFIENQLNLPVGVVYRVILILFILFMTLKSGIRKNFINWFVVFFLLLNSLLLVLQAVVLMTPIFWLLEDFISLTKYFLWPAIFFYVYQNRNKLNLSDFQRTFLRISCFFTLGMLVPYLFGVGTSTYALEGYKSFFYAQNDLSIAFIICITFTLNTLVQQSQKKWDLRTLLLFLLFTGNVLSMLLIGTKTTIGYSMICVLFLMGRLLGKSTQGNIIVKLLLWFASFVFLLWFCLWGWEVFLTIISGTINRMNYFYKEYDGDLLRLLSSSRLLFLQGSLTAFFNETSFLLTFFIGQGFSYRLNEYGRMGLIEMDFFDLWFSLGTIGFLLFAFLLVFFIWQLRKKHCARIYAFLFYMVLFFSFFVGHVFFSGLSAMLFGLICGGIFLQDNERV